MSVNEVEMICRHMVVPHIGGVRATVLQVRREGADRPMRGAGPDWPPADYILNFAPSSG